MYTERYAGKTTASLLQAGVTGITVFSTGFSSLHPEAATWKKQRKINIIKRPKQCRCGQAPLCTQETETCVVLIVVVINVESSGESGNILCEERQNIDSLIECNLNNSFEISVASFAT